jgi:hypothetical protein
MIVITEALNPPLASGKSILSAQELIVTGLPALNLRHAFASHATRSGGD